MQTSQENKGSCAFEYAGQTNFLRGQVVECSLPAKRPLAETNNALTAQKRLRPNGQKKEPSAPPENPGMARQAATAAHAETQPDDSASDEDAAPVDAVKGKAKRRKAPPQAAGPRARDGGHANFVRMANQKGKSAFKFKSRSGCSSTNPKNRKWAARKMAQESLPVAGLGADSTRESHMVRRRAALFLFLFPGQRAVANAHPAAGLFQVWPTGALGVRMHSDAVTHRRRRPLLVCD